MARVSLYWRAVRPFAFTVSVIPPILGVLIAVLENTNIHFNWLHFFLSLIGCMAAHAGANVLSDYFDYKIGVDREGTFGSSGVLVGKLMTPGQILRLAMALYVVAAAIAAYLVYAITNGIFLLWLVAIGGILGVFYTAGPIKFKYRAMGDVAVFISFGSAMTLGAYFVQAHRFSWSPVLYAIPIALLVDAILHSNNLRDIKNDAVVNIKTIPILIGEKSAQKMYVALVLGAYVFIPILVIFANLPLISLITMISLPLALKNIKLVLGKNNIPEEQFAIIDAATAQLHTAFSLLMIVSFIIQHFIVA